MTTMMVALVLLALGGLAHTAHASPTLIFVLAAGAIIPLASIMGEATEELSKRHGPAVGGLLNASFGNATELILALASLRQGGVLIDMVKASITGSIIGNLLLVLGLSVVAGGLRQKSLRINAASANYTSSMMLMAVIGLVVPAVYAATAPPSQAASVSRLSLAVAVVLLVIYGLGLVFSLGTHRQLFEAEGEEQAPQWSVSRALTTLVASTLAVVVASELLVGAVEHLIADWHLSPLFLGAVVIAIVGNAAEHAVAVMMARQGKMDLAYQIACGSSAQVALFVAPVLVLASLWLGHPMDLVFTTFEVLAVVVSLFIVTAVSADGETNWFEGVQLLGVYAILCCAFYCL